eukprot:SAG31_NODE_3096_length_4680_cov_1.703995_5_plen_63_part_00
MCRSQGPVPLYVMKIASYTRPEGNAKQRPRKHRPNHAHTVESAAKSTINASFLSLVLFYLFC